MDTKKVISNACANREFVYQYLWRLFSDVPDEALLDAFCGEVGRQLALFFDAESPALREHELMHCDVEGAQGENALVSRLSSEYTELFVGPGKLPASPWESVYACGEELVFQQSTLDVRAAYRAAGFKASGYPHIPDDHIATEFAFMAALCEKTERAATAGDLEQARVLLGRQAMFLAQHIGLWIGDFSQRLANNAPKSTGRFYMHAANLARDVCDADSAAVSELLEACEEK